jgi:hypothetical protein
MRTFTCACGARVFFDNSLCLSCGGELGFALEPRTMLRLEPSAEGVFASGDARYEKCLNYATQGVCNWVVPAGGEEKYCSACRLNNVIPDLSDPARLARWAEVEKAKRRLVYTLHQLHLPLLSKADDPERGLAFDIKSDDGGQRVVTGHAEGLVTLNLAEADTVFRERTRLTLSERYRTLLGHFRHEVGHYFWERLIRDHDRFDAFRELFGDERRDYAESLKQHYAATPNGGNNWSDEYISSYAASHPWEDWAETFAHYLHLIDTLDTAQEFGFTGRLSARTSLPSVKDTSLLIEEWRELTVALNSLSRSMGVPDPYPFAITPPVAKKLDFVHALVRAAPTSAAAAPP